MNESKVSCASGGIVKLAKLLALCEALNAVREDVHLEELETDEAHGEMILRVGDVLVCAVVIE